LCFSYTGFPFGFIAISERRVIFTGYIQPLKIYAMKTLFFTVILILSVTCIYAQKTEKKSKKELKAEKKAQQIAQIKAIVESKNFIFKASTVNPANTTTKTLTSDFGIEIRNDSIFSYMPYYGNTYSRDYSSNNTSPMGFIQPVDTYEMEKTKSGYDVHIKVQNVHDVIDLVFHISEMGSASVAATSINRQAISYTGDILVPQAKE
jgi:hypothetical protein